MKFRLALVAALAAPVLGSPAYAHHSYAMFDQDKTMKLEGTVKQFDFVNPHSWLHVMAPNPQGVQEEWTLELGSPGQLTRRGWKRNSVAPGEKITVQIHPLKDGTKGGAFMSAVDAAGQAIPASAG